MAKMWEVDPQLEVSDPTPNIFDLFNRFNEMYFFGELRAVEVKWSPQMTSCAGVCSYQGRGGLCSVRLSKPLLALRPRSDLVNTLLHEMIHAFLFVTHNNKDHNDHGTEFHKHMHRLNDLTGANVTVYHSFHDEVSHFKQHWWRCDGACRERRPFCGYVKRARNRAPSKNDFWFAEHQLTCGGTFVKIRSPPGYEEKVAAKESKKDQSVSTKKGKAAAIASGNKSIMEFLSDKGDNSSDQNSTSGETSCVDRSSSSDSTIISLVDLTKDCERITTFSTTAPTRTQPTSSEGLALGSSSARGRSRLLDGIFGSLPRNSAGDVVFPPSKPLDSESGSATSQSCQSQSTSQRSFVCAKPDDRHRVRSVVKPISNPDFFSTELPVTCGSKPSPDFCKVDGLDSRSASVESRSDSPLQALDLCSPSSGHSSSFMPTSKVIRPSSSPSANFLGSASSDRFLDENDSLLQMAISQSLQTSGRATLKRKAPELSESDPEFWHWESWN